MSRVMNEDSYGAMRATGLQPESDQDDSSMDEEMEVKQDGMSSGMVIGLVIVGVLVVCLIIVAIVACVCMGKEDKSEPAKTAAAGVATTGGSTTSTSKVAVASSAPKPTQAQAAPVATSGGSSKATQAFQLAAGAASAAAGTAGLVLGIVALTRQRREELQKDTNFDKHHLTDQQALLQRYVNDILPGVQQVPDGAQVLQFVFKTEEVAKKVLNTAKEKACASVAEHGGLCSRISDVQPAKFGPDSFYALTVMIDPQGADDAKKDQIFEGFGKAIEEGVNFWKSDVKVDGNGKIHKNTFKKTKDFAHWAEVNQKRYPALSLATLFELDKDAAWACVPKALAGNEDIQYKPMFFFDNGAPAVGGGVGAAPVGTPATATAVSNAGGGDASHAGATAELADDASSPVELGEAESEGSTASGNDQSDEEEEGEVEDGEDSEDSEDEDEGDGKEKGEDEDESESEGEDAGKDEDDMGEGDEEEGKEAGNDEDEPDEDKDEGEDDKGDASAGDASAGDASAGDASAGDASAGDASVSTGEYTAQDFLDAKIPVEPQPFAEKEPKQRTREELMKEMGKGRPGEPTGLMWLGSGEEAKKKRREEIAKFDTERESKVVATMEAEAKEVADWTARKENYEADEAKRFADEEKKYNGGLEAFMKEHLHKIVKELPGEYVPLSTERAQDAGLGKPDIYYDGKLAGWSGFNRLSEEQKKGWDDRKKAAQDAEKKNKENKNKFTQEKKALPKKLDEWANENVPTNYDFIEEFKGNTHQLGRGGDITEETPEFVAYQKRKRDHLQKAKDDHYKEKKDVVKKQALARIIEKRPDLA